MSRTAASSEDSSKKDLLSQYLKKYKVNTNCLIYTPGEKQMEDLRTLISNLYNVKDNFVTVQLKGTEKDYDKIPVSSEVTKSNKTKRKVNSKSSSENKETETKTTRKPKQSKSDLENQEK